MLCYFDHKSIFELHAIDILKILPIIIIHLKKQPHQDSNLLSSDPLSPHPFGQEVNCNQSMYFSRNYLNDYASNTIDNLLGNAIHQQVHQCIRNICVVKI